jgi:hypothetical protein
VSDEPLKVAGQTVHLELPARMAVRVAIGSAMRDGSVIRHQHSAVLIVAGALLLCWPTGLAKATAEGLRYRHDLLEFGADAVDFFFAQGAARGESPEQTRREVIRAGNAALDLVQSSLITEEDLGEAKGNSKAPEGGGSESSSA